TASQRLVNQLASAWLYIGHNDSLRSFRGPGSRLDFQRCESLRCANRIDSRCGWTAKSANDVCCFEHFTRACASDRNRIGTSKRQTVAVTKTWFRTGTHFDNERRSCWPEI